MQFSSFLILAAILFIQSLAAADTSFLCSDKSKTNAKKTYGICTRKITDEDKQDMVLKILIQNRPGAAILARGAIPAGRSFTCNGLKGFKAEARLCADFFVDPGDVTVNTQDDITQHTYSPNPRR
ncbi:hypothetical protein PtA15_4A759 [Puccinia triticina]|uniref:Uncharacterized protein n=1 Tax=Puccinia triticina TaxID=208348 RepID=A0ABY7CGF1_9BASI|nr:uncharacterized protein PtA15_4A759 [Puccinia triticina]WAQ84306.1 hypothetical protein PtA15_4A759 [Puccinia triticina]